MVLFPVKVAAYLQFTSTGVLEAPPESITPSCAPTCHSLTVSCQGVGNMALGSQGLVLAQHHVDVTTVGCHGQVPSRTTLHATPFPQQAANNRCQHNITLVHLEAAAVHVVPTPLAAPHQVRPPTQAGPTAGAAWQVHVAIADAARLLLQAELHMLRERSLKQSPSRCVPDHRRFSRAPPSHAW